MDVCPTCGQRLPHRGRWADELAARNRAAADAVALRLWRGVVGAQRRAGDSHAAIADTLNAGEVPTPSGRGRWHATSVARVEARARRLEAQHGNGPLVTWEHLACLRSALAARRDRLGRLLHPRHGAELDGILSRLPTRPVGAANWDWVGLDVDGERVAEHAAAELQRVRQNWQEAREAGGERLARARRLWTRAHEVEPEGPEGLAEALLMLRLQRAEKSAATRSTP